jgi:hypothetical protein
MLDPQNFTLARVLCNERVHDNAHYVLESWWAAAPPPKWRQRFRQMGMPLRTILHLLARRGRVSVNGQWQETSA